MYCCWFEVCTSENCHVVAPGLRRLSSLQLNKAGQKEGILTLLNLGCQDTLLTLLGSTCDTADTIFLRKLLELMLTAAVHGVYVCMCVCVVWVLHVYIYISRVCVAVCACVPCQQWERMFDYNQASASTSGTKGGKALFLLDQTTAITTNYISKLH